MAQKVKKVRLFWEIRFDFRVDWFLVYSDGKGVVKEIWRFPFENRGGIVILSV